jgi:hypothetical protein
LIVCGDYKGNLEAIAKVLNGLEFDQDENRDRRFVVHDGRIKPDRFDIDSASAAFPLRGWYTQSTWWAGVKSKRFPQPIKFGPKITAWRVEDIRAFIERTEQTLH